MRINLSENTYLSIYYIILFTVLFAFKITFCTAKNDLHIQFHLRWRNDEIQRHFRMAEQFVRVVQFGNHPAVRRFSPTLIVNSFHLLDYFEQERSAGHSAGFEGWSYSQTDDFIGAGFIRYNQVSGERIQSALDRFPKCEKDLRSMAM